MPCTFQGPAPWSGFQDSMRPRPCFPEEQELKEEGRGDGVCKDVRVTDPLSLCNCKALRAETSSSSVLPHTCHHKAPLKATVRREKSRIQDLKRGRVFQRSSEPKVLLQLQLFPAWGSDGEMRK